ncbi:hypothetical protein P280DRAFT_388017 [Massarina eburnea CBS 473.64]|uniref:Mitochondrial ribosomal protein-like protein n=1 Tax=Massarina eburnea CBS 473.64 TaxID=1395130 RepID=A0A6A6SKB4_9PLEO|nr:hypothetical protein P280DRAFT_388017 [Massarina eburnea CBS 473.64]
MSTALTSSRTGASRAGAAFLKTTSPKKPAIKWRQSQGSQHAKGLAEEMHRNLYPYLYGENGQPTVKIHKTPEYKPRIVTRGGEEKEWQNAAEFFKSRLMGMCPPSTPPIKKTCHDPVSAVTASQIALLDPTSSRTKLFDRQNPECARVGDILLVRLRTGDPFAGVCINIRRRGVDTAILLRGQLTRVGVEMWYKIYSPVVEGIEVVQRAAKRARRARLTYMRKVKHDRGSVENVVRIYLRQKAALGAVGEDGKSGGKAKAKAMAMAGGKKKGGRGKKR